MKICPKCKKQYEDNQKFCKICGVPLVEAKKKKGIGIYLLIGVAVVAVCAGAVAGVMIIKNKKQEARLEAMVDEAQEENTDNSSDTEEKSSAKEDVKKEEAKSADDKVTDEEQEKTEEEKKKEEEKQKEEEEQKELWKKYEEQEAKEAETNTTNTSKDGSSNTGQDAGSEAQTNQTTSTWDATGQTQDEMIQHIRNVYYDTQAKLSHYSTDGSQSSLTIYTENNNLKKIVSQNGVCSGDISGLPQDYSAEFYYENNTLLFAFVYKGQEEYRFYMSPNDETKCIRYIGPDGAVQDFETPVASTGLGNGIGEFCKAGYMEPYWLGKK